MAGLYRFVVRFVDKASGKPVTGPAYRVRFFDKDIIHDNRLGESPLDGQGSAGVIVSSAAFKGLDSPGETEPDLYCVLMKDGQQVFKTPVRMNVKVEATDPVTGRDARTIDLGVFKV
ncbi:MAG: hypothetical protein FJ255_05560 [Phycisphaerae bacterium]|nr:hypothetical protein [Phycisphaerae bacterium]